jgi:hypothetical protein
MVPFPCQFLTDWMARMLKTHFFLTHYQPLSCTINTDHPLTTSISLLISFVYLFYKFDFKIIIMVTITIIGHNRRKDETSFRKSFWIMEMRELAQVIELLMDKHKVSALQACLLIGVHQIYYT